MEDSPSQTHRCFLLLSLMSCAQYTNVPSKNMKNVQFDEYFADKKMLLLSVKSQMSIRGEGGFSEHIEEDCSETQSRA